jgi:hypothetical protein
MFRACYLTLRVIGWGVKHCMERWDSDQIWSWNLQTRQPKSRLSSSKNNGWTVVGGGVRSVHSKSPLVYGHFPSFRVKNLESFTLWEQIWPYPLNKNKCNNNSVGLGRWNCPQPVAQSICCWGICTALSFDQTSPRCHATASDSTLLSAAHAQ